MRMSTISAETIHRNPTAENMGRHRLWWGIVMAVVLLVGFGALWLTGAFSQKSDLRTFMGSEINADIAPRDVSTEVCGRLHCASAWDTKVGRFMEFDHEGDAEYWETVLGDDARRNDHWLVDFSDRDLNRDEIKHAVDTLFSDRDWS